MELTKLFDKYNLFARIFPVLLILSPCVITILIFLPKQKLDPYSSIAWGAIFVGIIYILAMHSRSTGKGLEGELIKEWGGLPTTIFLRHRDHMIPKVTKLRYHQYLSNNVPTLGQMPTEKQEQLNPESSDEIYNSVIMWLKEQRRDNRLYPVVNQELTEYGFRRNIAGIRKIGIIIYCLCLLTSLIFVIVNNPEILVKHNICSFLLFLLDPSHAIFGVILLNLLAIYLVLSLNNSWVKEAAINYAKSLLSTCDA